MTQIRPGLEWINFVTHKSMQLYIYLDGLIQSRRNPNPLIPYTPTAPRILNKLQDIMQILSPENYVR